MGALALMLAFGMFVVSLIGLPCFLRQALCHKNGHRPEH
ncbi:putative holin-like toxin [Loigolactobacillus coryniformis]